MRYHFFAIPVLDPSAATSELNQFLSTHRVVAVDRELIHDGQRSTWAVCVSVAPGGGPKPAPQASLPPLGRNRIDYKTALPPEQFATYARLRTLRRDLAQRDGVPPYAVFTNAQLAAMVQQNIHNKTQLATLPGVGPARIKKYAEPFLAALTQPPDAPAEDA